VTSTNVTLADDVARLAELGARGPDVGVKDVREAIVLVKDVFTTLMLADHHPARGVRALTTKFRDAGRRSPPWRPTSSRVPGRPQDGADGNRITRWLLPKDHKFYAHEISSTLVEVKYYLQALSMKAAPILPNKASSTAFEWLLEHPVEPGRYLDPVQLVDIDIREVVKEPRTIQSGHLVPLDRGGRHEPDNAFLMLKDSNDLQGSLTLDELLALMQRILERHHARKRKPRRPESKSGG